MPAPEAADPLRILFVLDGSANTPSARVRALQYRDLLERRKDVRVAFATHRPPWLTVLQDLALRWRLPNRVQSWLARRSSRLAKLREPRIVRMAADYDIVYVVKVPSLTLYERLSRVKGPMVFMDLNDGLWLPFHRGAGWGDLDRMLALSPGVICENRYVLEYARKFTNHAYVVHDPPQVEAFDALRGKVKRDPEKIVIGWLGSTSSCDALYSIWEPLEALFAKYPQLHLRLVGAREDRIPRFEKVRFSIRGHYDQTGMIQEVMAMDIGLFPLFKVEDALVRGTLKAMVYMSGEAVAVATRVGENEELIRDGENGMLADSPREWVEKLERLIEDPRLRKRLGQAGLETIRAKFTRERCLEDLLAAFRSGLAGRPDGV